MRPCAEMPDRGDTIRPGAVLFDRDGTLIHDVPDRRGGTDARLVPDAVRAVTTARRAGLAVGLVTNQPGIATGAIGRADVDALHDDLARRVGGLDAVLVCPHPEGARCGCRKPAPGLVLGAAAALDVVPARCVVIGDISSDVEAADRAGARGILVPNGRTLPAEVRAARFVATDLVDAVEIACALLGIRVPA